MPRPPLLPSHHPLPLPALLFVAKLRPATGPAMEPAMDPPPRCCRFRAQFCPVLLHGVLGKAPSPRPVLSSPLPFPSSSSFSFSSRAARVARVWARVSAHAYLDIIETQQRQRGVPFDGAALWAKICSIDILYSNPRYNPCYNRDTNTV